MVCVLGVKVKFFWDYFLKGSNIEKVFNVLGVMVIIVFVFNMGIFLEM